MNRENEKQFSWKLKSWHTILIFSFLLMGVYALGTYFFDFFAGSATAGFGKMGEIYGTGMFFIYMIGYFISIIIIFPILIIKRFGTGVLLYLPYAVIGFFVEYYYEWIMESTLVGPWGAAGWCIAGLAIGLSVDIAYRFLPHRLSLKIRSVIMGFILGCASFLFTLLPLLFFYKVPVSVKPVEPGSFLGVAYFCLPWLIINCGFGGYTAYSIFKSLKLRK
jgi:hypothetical protein